MPMFSSHVGGVTGRSILPVRPGPKFVLVLAFFVAVQRLAGAPATFVFTSDVHFGLHRGSFRGAANVEARVVGAAMVDAINRLPAKALPRDDGLRAGEVVGPVEFVVITGDLTNRQERLPVRIQSAAESWAQIEAVFFGGLALRNARGANAPLLVVPGNHDVSNAIGHPNGLLPATDATTLAGIYNRMLRPTSHRTKDSFRRDADRIHYSRDFGGVHCVFLTVWPDRVARDWLESDLAQVPATTPVFLFAHDPPKVDARHFTNPHGVGDVNARDKFENVLEETFTAGGTADGSTEPQQRAFAAFLKKHRNIAAYFHGHANWNEFYTWKGPDQDLALPCFRADSPVKGRTSGNDETQLSFQVVTFDVDSGKLTARECRWNARPDRAGSIDAIGWGDSITVRLRRP